MRIKANNSIVINDDGTPISIPYHGNAEVDNTLAGEVIDAGLAVEYETTSPTGQMSINDNGVYDVFDYAEVSVNVPKESGGSGDFTLARITGHTASGSINVYGASIVDANGSKMLAPVFELTDTSTEVEAVLYKGVAVFLITDTPADTVTCTGGVVYNAEMEAYVVTGDGTITIDGGQ